MNPSDIQIQQEVLTELSSEVLLADARIEVEVDDGWVILCGSVGSDAQCATALNAARRVTGVIHAGNDLTVVVADPPEGDDIAFLPGLMHELECDDLAAV